MSRLRQGAAAVMVICVAAACSSSKGAANRETSAAAPTKPAPPRVSQPYVGYPDAIVVLGHSGSTGESSDPSKPVGFETRTNSWVTGTNPDVDSLYLRILAVHPQIRNHNISLSRGGATVDDALAQAQAAVAQHPRNALVIIQLVDNDIVCPAAPTDYTHFQTRLEAVLKQLDTGLPTSKVFVVSHYGTAANDFKALTAAQRREEGGTGPCAFIDPKGHLVPAELARLDNILLGYDAALKAGCEKFARCRYDDGAFRDAPSRAKYTSPIDLNHFSIAGHAKAAAVAWQALTRAGLVPAVGQ